MVVGRYLIELHLNRFSYALDLLLCFLWAIQSVEEIDEWLTSHTKVRSFEYSLSGKWLSKETKDLERNSLGVNVSLLGKDYEFCFWKLGTNSNLDGTIWRERND